VFESNGVLPRLAAGLAHGADRWIEIRPLYRFCAKFQPQWRERSLMLGSWWSLAAVGAAAIITELRPDPHEAIPMRPTPHEPNPHEANPSRAQRS
jgi:lysylphosphatidylglycerol synthetase-like protein (DUF2156 family)